MKIPELTPQRQKMLLGATAAGLLLVLGFSFAPKLEVADETEDEVDEVLAIVEGEREPQAAPEKAVEPRSVRRPRSLGKTDDSTSLKRIERPRELPLAVVDAEESAPAAPARVVPPAYQQRLELLAEEEVELLRHQRRGSDKS